MTPYRIIALPTPLVDKVRSTQRSPGYGHPAHTEIAQGYGPCRHCLRTFEVGEEERLLFTLDSFEGIESQPLPGPVYIHAESCDRYPENGNFPKDLRDHALTFQGYGRGRRFIAQAFVEDGAVEAVLERLLVQSDVDYVQVHDTSAGCYDFRIVPLEPR